MAERDVGWRLGERGGRDIAVEVNVTQSREEGFAVLQVRLLRQEVGVVKIVRDGL